MEISGSNNTVRGITVAYNGCGGISMSGGNQASIATYAPSLESQPTSVLQHQLFSVLARGAAEQKWAGLRDYCLPCLAV